MLKVKPHPDYLCEPGRAKELMERLSQKNMKGK